ncbi:MAG: hypothetical protein HQL19_08235 [Candidatus Omnitrophica bacterium]|nr:hypothetical protein [Candidatus Omnitrophota bacterium]
MVESKKQKKITGIVLLVIMGVMTVYMLIVWVFNYKTLEKAVDVLDKTAVSQAQNVRYYSNEYKVTKVKLDETTAKLVQITAELEAANAELSTARQEVASLQQVNDQIKADIQTLEHFKAKALSKGEALENMIMVFKKKNKELDIQLQGVRKELAVFQPEIGDLNEGKAKIQNFKDHINMVKRNMHGIKVKAWEAKVSAQKERDRVEELYGNNGYLVKNGKDQSVVINGKKIDIRVELK